MSCRRSGLTFGPGRGVPDRPGHRPWELISAEAARRLACDARITPTVLAGAGQPLDVGRTTRSIPPAIRTALNVRDNGCAFPGCEAKKAWCDGHHITHWSAGGTTSLQNLVLLCGSHHATVHHGGWTIWIDTDGLPTLEPPPWVDPDRAATRHHRYPLRQISTGTAGPAPPGQT